MATKFLDGDKQSNLLSWSVSDDQKGFTTLTVGFDSDVFLGQAKRRPTNLERMTHRSML
jgi:hypothetical protein